MSITFRSITALAASCLCSACLVSCREKQPAKTAPPPVPSQSNTFAPTTTAPTPASGVLGEPGKPQTVDIFSGKPVNRSVYSDYKSERIYFCCPTSRQKFENDPAFYHGSVKKQGILLDAAK
jgi:YHS domain-containing protein